MKFEIGDKVYCSYNEATGTITGINLTRHILYVTFKNGTTGTYTLKKANYYNLETII